MSWTRELAVQPRHEPPNRPSGDKSDCREWNQLNFKFLANTRVKKQIFNDSQKPTGTECALCVASWHFYYRIKIQERNSRGTHEESSAKFCTRRNLYEKELGGPYGNGVMSLGCRNPRNKPESPNQILGTNYWKAKLQNLWWTQHANRAQIHPWGKFINIMMSVKWMFHTFIAMYESLLKLLGF